MARPKKNNAEYYTHDADMRNDIKVKALRRKFSHMGYAVWNYLLETLTDNDYFEITWDEINIELLAADYDVSVEELTEIVAYCVKIGLLQLENDVLRSDALQNRFNELLDNRVKKSEAGKKGMAKRWGQKDNIVIKSDNSVITPLQKTITENNKVKESKVKESKVKKEREEIHTYVCKEKKPSADAEIFSSEKDSGNNAQLISEEEKKEKKVAPKRESRFTPPTLEEIKDYEAQKGYTFSAERFWGYYESNGWRALYRLEQSVDQSGYSVFLLCFPMYHHY